MAAILLRSMIVLGALALSSQSFSTPRFNALKYSCDAIQSLIDEHGAAIFRYPSPRKPGLTLYDRYVRNDHFCSPYQTTQRVLIPSSDSNNCPVRRCVTDDCKRIGMDCLFR